MNKLTCEDIMDMKKEEVDRHIHEIFFDGESLLGFTYRGSDYNTPESNQYVKETKNSVIWRSVPCYSTDMSLAWLVEEKIKNERIQMQVYYNHALKEVIFYKNEEYVGWFDYIHATAEQRCRAALLMMERNNKNG